MIKKLAKLIAGHPGTVVIVATVLLIPAVIAYITTDINYDILTYLPQKLESVQGEKVLDETFNDAAMAMIITEDYNEREVAALKDEIGKISGVRQALWVNDIVDITVPKEMLPDILSSVFYSADGSSTMMLVQFTQSGSSESTMNALKEIRKIMNKTAS